MSSQQLLLLSGSLLGGGTLGAFATLALTLHTLLHALAGLAGTLSLSLLAAGVVDEAVFEELDVLLGSEDALDLSETLLLGVYLGSLLGGLVLLLGVLFILLLLGALGLELLDLGLLGFGEVEAFEGAETLGALLVALALLLFGALTFGASGFSVLVVLSVDGYGHGHYSGHSYEKFFHNRFLVLFGCVF